jgi:hypothetical protein
MKSPLYDKLCLTGNKNNVWHAPCKGSAALTFRAALSTLPVSPTESSYTSQMSTACRNEVRGSLFGTNSCPTYP